jgi:serine O-acetyltransferase
MPTLILEAESIGPGLFIQHGYCTSVATVTIGKNCWMNQLVTVGYTNETDHPTIGDNVRILTGATILGKVHIGDNSKIGANSLVIDDVPAGVTVMGVPAKIIWRSPPAEGSEATRQAPK